MEALASMKLAELDVRHRIVAAKRELQRSMSASAVAVDRQRKRVGAIELKQALEQKVGLEHSDRIKHVPTATADEMLALSEKRAGLPSAPSWQRHSPTAHSGHGALP